MATTDRLAFRPTADDNRWLAIVAAPPPTDPQVTLCQSGRLSQEALFLAAEAVATKAAATVSGVGTGNMPITKRPSRKRRQLPENTLVGVWSAEAAASVSGYPKSPEAYDNQRAALRANKQKAQNDGTLNRMGVPNGYRGMKPEIEASRRNSRTEAEMIIEVFMPVEDRQTQDDRRGVEAMTFLCEVMRSPLNPACLRLQAARQLAEYLVPRPAKKTFMANPSAFIDALIAKGITGTQTENEPGE